MSNGDEYVNMAVKTAILQTKLFLFGCFAKS